MRGSLRLVLFAIAVLAAAPSGAFAQASIAGAVKDTSGAVLPGVSVEASSPALIEKTRSAVTDGAGQYKIEALQPGTYAVTFTLAGFNTVKREGIELTGTATVQINAELRVGAVAETITVTGETPLVDVQNSSVQKTVTADVLDAVPSGRIGTSIAVLIPGMIVGATGGAGQGQASSLTTQDVGGTVGDPFTDLSIHGSRPGDMKTMIDGQSIATQIRFGESPSSSPSFASMQEMSIDTSGGDASSAGGGVRINYIPRTGGNSFHGLAFVSGANESMQSSNYSADLQSRGLRAPNRLQKQYDINPGGGGPIVKDRVWFFATARWINAINYVAGNYPNKNAYDKNSWTYVADTSQPQGTSESYLREETVRLDVQINSKNKIGLYYVDKYRCTCLSVSPTTSLEAVNNQTFYPFSDQLAEWTSPVTSRLLLQASIFHHQETWGGTPAPFDVVDPSLIGVTLQSAPPGQSITTYRGRVGSIATPSHNPNTRTRFDLSYVTGSHAFKTGVDHSWSFRNAYSFSYQPVTYVLTSSGVPVGLNLVSNTWPTPIIQSSNVKSDGGAYAQDKWTRGRMTLQGGVRFDWFYAYLPEQTLSPSVLTPNRNITFPEYDTLGWKDVTPKVGLAYDLFGNGKTALKVSLGKYVLGQAGLLGNGLTTAGPAFNVSTTATRTWNDTNHNMVPDCDLANLSLNGECGPTNPQTFGSTVPALVIDPNIKFGWGKRQYDWEFGVSGQHDLGRGMSVYGGFFRRWYGNFYATDNLAVSASDFQQYSITAPANSLLPGGGGYPVTGLYAISASKFGLTNNYQTFADNYGKQIDHWNGFDLGLNARMRQGVIFQGGISSGYQLLDSCAVAAQLPETLTTLGVLSPLSTCRVKYPWLTQFKLLTSYTIPKADVQVSGTFQSIPGFERSAANAQIANALISAAIGRPVPGSVNNAGNTTINIVPPGTYYGDRVNQLDVRFGKVLRFGRTRSVVSVDLFNALNANPVTSESLNLANWQTPLAVLTPRLVKLTYSVNF